MGEGTYSSTILDLDTTRRQVVSFKPHPVYLLRKNRRYPFYSGWVGPRSGLDAGEEKNLLPRAGKRATIPGCRPLIY
jgi:hypothetical protein